MQAADGSGGAAATDTGPVLSAASDSPPPTPVKRDKRDAWGASRLISDWIKLLAKRQAACMQANADGVYESGDLRKAAELWCQTFATC